MTTYAVTALRHLNISMSVEAESEDAAVAEAERVLGDTAAVPDMPRQWNNVTVTAVVDAMTEVVGVEAAPDSRG